MVTYAAFVLVTAFTVFAACSGDDGAGPAPLRPDSTVSMPGFSFVPFTLNIKVGGTVIFDFPAESHNVIFAKLPGAPQDIEETVNRRIARTFNSAGGFPYDCTIHPGMSGVIVVQ